MVDLSASASHGRERAGTVEADFLKERAEARDFLMRLRVTCRNIEQVLRAHTALGQGRRNVLMLGAGVSLLAFTVSLLLLAVVALADQPYTDLSWQAIAIICVVASVPTLLCGIWAIRHSRKRQVPIDVSHGVHGLESTNTLEGALKRHEFLMAQVEEYIASLHAASLTSPGSGENRQDHAGLRDDLAEGWAKLKAQYMAGSALLCWTWRLPNLWRRWGPEVASILPRLSQDQVRQTIKTATERPDTLGPYCRLCQGLTGEQVDELRALLPDAYFDQTLLIVGESTAVPDGLVPGTPTLKSENSQA